MKRQHSGRCAFPFGCLLLSSIQDAAEADWNLTLAITLSAPFWLSQAARRYIPVNVPLVKRVAAESGDRVCALGQDIFINGRWIAERREVDGRSRPMP